MRNRFNEPAPSEHQKSSKFDMCFTALSVVDGQIRIAKPQLLVNGEAIREKLPVDIRQVVNSLKGKGQFFIFTCSCGDAYCGGVEEGVLVTQYPDSFVWEYRLPQSTDGFGFDGQSAREEWLAASTQYRHVFDRQQVLEALHACLSEAELTHADSAQYPPNGFERRHITQLLADVAELMK